MSISYKQLFPKVKTFIFDVDGVLTNGLVTIYPDGSMVRHFNVKDSYALRVAIKEGFRICVITGGASKEVEDRLNDIGVTDVYLNSRNKIDQYQDFVIKYNLDPESILYMGDDIPDYPVMEKVGLACCPNNATREIQSISHYISDYKGGEGAVRDVIEQVLRVQDKWDGHYSV